MQDLSVDETCPPEDEFAAFVGGRLARRQIQIIEAHVARCAPCRQLLSALAQTRTPAPARADSVSPTLPRGEDGSGGELTIGDVIGRYRVLDWLGSGGMGAVYAAYDPELDRKVALKVLHEGIAGHGARQPLRDLLQHEAQAMAQLAHANVVTVFDVGSVGDRVFIAMELIEGATLTRWLRAAPRSASEILAAFIAAGNGLAAAHAAGLIHRDFKPDNVLVGKDGRICVTDFGVARLATTDSAGAAAGAPATPRTTGPAGTLAYMAPEQYAGQVDPRSDQFSFAVSLYEAFEGERPHAPRRWPGGGGRPAEPLPARPRGSRIPRRVYRVLRRALNPAPDERYPSMAGLLAGLGPPPGRRGRALAIGAAAAVIATIAGAIVYAIEVRGAAAERTEVASRLRALAPELRTQLRGAHMLPLHDIRPAREQVRRAIREVERRTTSGAGTEATALRDYVLGEGARALGDHDRALGLFEMAWAAGERDPELEAALGSELGAMYERRFHELETTVPSNQREPELRAIAQRYRDPAIGHLRVALTAGRGSPAYLEALIAFHDHRFSEASARAHAAFTASPTFYEAGELEARAHHGLGIQHMAAGEHAAAEAEFATARRIFESVVEIARSDDAEWLAFGAMVWDHAVQLYAGETPGGLLDQAMTALHKAQQINPDNAQAYVQEAQIETGHANREILEGRDPSVYVAKALALTAEARRHGGASKAIAYYDCVAHWELAEHRARHGIDPRGEYDAAIAQCEIAAAADADSYGMLGILYASLGRFDGRRGGDPTQLFERAERNYRAAIALVDDFSARYGLACLWLSRAGIEAEHGQDPRRALDAAQAAFEATLEKDADNRMSLAGLANALGGRARRQLEDHEATAPTLAQAHRAVARIFALDPDHVVGLIARLSLREIEAEDLLQHGSDPAPALARVNDDVARLQRLGAGDSVVALRSCQAELVAARWALAHHGAVAPILVRATDAAARARTIDAADAMTWFASAEVEQLRAEAMPRVRAAAIADGLAYVERALAIDRRRVRALDLRDALHRAADRDRDTNLHAGSK